MSFKEQIMLHSASFVSFPVRQICKFNFKRILINFMREYFFFLGMHKSAMQTSEANVSSYPAIAWWMQFLSKKWLHSLFLSIV